MRAYILAILGALLTGCVSTTAYFRLNPPNEKEATVQFIRPYLVPTGFPLQIFVNGKKAARLSNRAHISFSVPAGEHEILLDWPPGSLVMGSLKEKYVFLGGESRHFLVNDRSTILLETLVDKNRLSLTELSTEESQRYQHLLGQSKKAQNAIAQEVPGSNAQHETKMWLSVNAGWSTLPDTDLGGFQFTVNPKKMLISIEYMYDESLTSTGVNTDVYSLLVGYVFNNPSSKIIYYGQLGPSSVSQYTLDCLFCNPYNRKESIGIAGEVGISLRPFKKVPFGFGSKAIFNLNGVESFTSFLFSFYVVRL